MASNNCFGSIVNSLKLLGYDGCLLSEEVMKSCISKGTSSVELMDLFTSVCKELKSLYQLSETVNKPPGPEEAETFFLELIAFLRDLKCSREDLDLLALRTCEGMLNCLEYLLGELLAARLGNGPEDDRSSLPKDSVGMNLTLMLNAYQLSVPPSTVTTKQIMLRLIQKVKESMSQVSEKVLKDIETPMLKEKLSAEQWSEVEDINQSLSMEYRLRREVMLKRADVTVESFSWSNKLEGKKAEYDKVHKNLRQPLTALSQVSIARLLAARQDLTAVKRTSSETTMRCDVNKVLIGKVPDRGGRPMETRPPPEMPSFKPRVELPKEKRDWSGRGRGGRGHQPSRVQGGWAARKGGRGSEHYGGGRGSEQYGGGRGSEQYGGGRGSGQYGGGQHGGQYGYGGQYVGQQGQYSGQYVGQYGGQFGGQQGQYGGQFGGQQGQYGGQFGGQQGQYGGQFGGQQGQYGGYEEQYGGYDGGPYHGGHGDQYRGGPQSRRGGGHGGHGGRGNRSHYQQQSSWDQSHYY